MATIVAVGFDPGIRNLGYGVIAQDLDDDSFELVESGDNDPVKNALWCFVAADSG